MTSTRADTVAVVGAGDASAAVARVAAGAGHHVRVLHDDADAAARIVSMVNRSLRTRGGPAAHAHGTVAAGSPGEAWRSSFVIETLADDLGAKRELLRRLDAVCGGETILASCVCRLSITALAVGLGDPARLIGLNFIDTGRAPGVVEVVSGRATRGDVARRAGHLVTGWGKRCVHARSTPGFIVARVMQPYRVEAARLLAEGVVSPAELDALMTGSGGFDRGPEGAIGRTDGGPGPVAESLYHALFEEPRFRPLPVEGPPPERIRPASAHAPKNPHPSRGGPDAPAAPPWPESAPPAGVVIRGDLGVASALAGLWRRQGIEVLQRDGDGSIEFDGVRLAMTDGRTATERASAEAHGALALFDLCADYVTCARIAVAAADQCPPGSARRAAALFQSIGKSVSLIGDTPGMVVMRSLCMLANEGADVVQQGVCDVKAVDVALRYGAGLPLGPMAWADRVGLAWVAGTLDNLFRHYGEDRYRVSALLRRRSLCGSDFYAS